MGSLGTFWAGFLARPVGAWILGGYADRHGRKPAMLLSMSLMGAGILILCLCPGYATIGIAAPVIAVLARLLQGFALGGEVGSATVYMMEAVADHRRGYSISWQGASQNIAASTGALVGLLLTLVMSDAELSLYGWRLALLLGTTIIPFAIIVRRSLPETIDAKEEAPVVAAGSGMRPYLRLVVLSILMIGSGTIGTYIFQYMATYGQNTLKLSSTVSMAGEFANNGIGIFSILVAGALSDRFGRKPVMIWTTALFMVLVVPCFVWLTNERDATSFIGANLLLSLLQTAAYGPLYAAISESLPKAVRARGFALIYALPVALFGGSTQLVVTWILDVTGNPMSIAWYLTGVTLIGLVAMILMRESAPVRRNDGQPEAIGVPLS